MGKVPQEVPLWWAQRGYKVFPLYGIDVDDDGIGACRCGTPDCRDAGKHPRTKAGFKDASVNDAMVSLWWKRWPNANIGIATGDAGNGRYLLILDIDAEGESVLAALEAKHGRLPETLNVTTGNGRHLYFISKANIKSGTNVLGKDFDVRCDGAYVVAAGSTHKTGVVYSIDRPPFTPSDAPDWLIRELGGHRKPGSSGANSGAAAAQLSRPPLIGKGRNDHLTKLAGVLRRFAGSRDVVMKAMVAENNDRFTKPLEMHELEHILDQAEGWMPDPIAASLLVQPDGTVDDWNRAVKHNNRGNITSDRGNAAVLLKHHPDWAGAVCYDLFAEKPRFCKDAPLLKAGDIRSPKSGEPISDWQITYIQHWMVTELGPSFSKDAVIDAVMLMGRSTEVHPPRDWLKSLEWDEKPRLATWLNRYLGATGADEYLSSVGQWWMISAVARLMRPGCKVDHMLVLEGPQDIGKSKGMRALCSPDWYLESLPQLNNKDAMVALAGHWICEINELQSFKGARASRIKEFLTICHDDFRMPYGHFNIVRPRQCVFVGTTNESLYLEDSTGGRRFWPVSCTNIDIKGIERDREQMWAEAVNLFDAGHQWWPTEELKSYLKDEQENRLSIDEWENLVRGWLRDRSHTTAMDVLENALELSARDWGRSEQIRVGKILVRLGYVRVRGSGGDRQYQYVKRVEE